MVRKSGLLIFLHHSGVSSQFLCFPYRNSISCLLPRQHKRHDAWRGVGGRHPFVLLSRLLSDSCPFFYIFHASHVSLPASRHLPLETPVQVVGGRLLLVHGSDLVEQFCKIKGARVVVISKTVYILHKCLCVCTSMGMLNKHVK